MGSSASAVGSQDDVLRQVSQVVLAVARQLSTRDVLQMIVRSARSLVRARYAALGVPDDQGSFAEFVVDGMSERQQKAIGPVPRQHGLLGVLLREGQPIRVDDIRADPRFEWWPAAHPDMSDFLGVPIRDGSDVLGIIFAACKRDPGGFTERDEELLGLFASHAAIALTNARLYERGRELSVLEERARLARELHDAVSQKLFSIRAKARAAEVLVGRDPGRAVAEIESVASLAGQAHAELRAVIDGLAPPDLAAGGLAGSLRSYAVLAGRTYGVGGAVRRGAAARARAAAGDRGLPGGPGGAAQRAAALRRGRDLRVAARPGGAGSSWRSADRGRGFAPGAGARRPGPGLDAGAGGVGGRDADSAFGARRGHAGAAGAPSGRAVMTSRSPC